MDHDIGNTQPGDDGAVNGHRVPPSKYPKPSLAEVREILRERAAHLTFTQVTADSIRLLPDGKLIVGSRELEVSSEASDTLARWAGLPTAPFRKLPADLRASVFNYLHVNNRHRAAAPALVSIAVDGAVVRALADGRLPLLSGQEVLDAVLAAALGGAVIGDMDLRVDRFHLDGFVSLSLVSPSMRTEPRPGDLVYAGTDLHHSETGMCATQVTTYLSRLVCSNGLLIRVCEHNKALRVRRDSFTDREALLGRIRRMAELAWAEMDLKLGILKQLAQERVDDQADVIEKLARGHGLPVTRRQVGELLKALDDDELGNGGTLYDIVNAFSRVGTHSNGRPLAWRRGMMFVSGAILGDRLERCPRCRSIMRHRR